MGSLYHRAGSGRSLAVDLGIGPHEDMYFSWSGIDLAVDLGIGKDSPENSGNDEIVARNLFAHQAIQQSDGHEDATNEPGATQESSTTQQGTGLLTEQSECRGDLTHEHLSAEESSGLLQATGLDKQSEYQEDTANEPGSTEECSNGNSEIVGRSSLRVDHVIEQSEDADDSTSEHCMTEESGSRQHHAIHQSDEQDSDEHASKEEENCGAEAEPQKSTSGFCTWPDWGEPLPLEETEDDMDFLESVAEVKRSHSSKKVVTFSDAVTFVEPISLQEVRETGSFSYLGSSDDELEQGTDQVTSSSFGTPSDLSPTRVSSSSVKELLDFADVSAACHLLELGNEVNCGDSKQNSFDSSGVLARTKCEVYDPSQDLEKLSEVVEELFAALAQRSIVSVSQGSFSSQTVGHWTVEVPKDSGRIRMKRIKHEEEVKCKLGLLGTHDFEDENDVLERPPWKRHYKSMGHISWQGQVSVF